MKRPFLDAPPTIPNHTLYHSIGRGSYGEVWLAMEDTLKRWRAVKVVSRRRDGDTDRGYQREFDAIQRYEDICRSHVSLMAILTVGRDVDDRFFYYSMDLADDVRTNGPLAEAVSSSEGIAPSVEGYEPRTLRSELRRKGRVSPAECVEMGIALANALEQLHRHGLIHRDIKPDNIIFVAGQPKFADVGLVAEVDATYSLAGTDAYLSPEVPRKEPADIYALGKVLYEMATGEEVGEFPALPKGFSGLTDRDQTGINELSAVFCRACEPGVQERYPSAKHLREDLELLKQNGSVIRSRELEKQAEELRKQAERQAEELKQQAERQAVELKARAQEQERRRRRFLRIAFGVGSAVVLAFLGIYFQTTRQRAADRAIALELREAQIQRTGQRPNGWSSDHWARLKRAADSGFDQNEIKAQAAIMMAGLDAKSVAVFPDMVGADAAFAPDGRALTAGDGTRPAVMIQTNGTRTNLPVVSEGKACWTADGMPLIFAVETNAGVLREAYTGVVRRSFPLAADERVIIQSSSPVLAAMPDGSRFAASVSNGSTARVIVWNVSSEAPLGEVRTQINVRVTALAFTPGSSLLAAGGLDGVTRVYSLPDLRPVALLRPPVRPNPIQCLAFTRDRLMRPDSAPTSTNWLLAVGDLGTELVIWDVGAGQPRAFCRGSHWELESLAFSPDGGILASGGRMEPRLWDAHSGEFLLRLTAGAMGSDTTALAFSPDGRRLLAGSRTNSSGPFTSILELEADRGIQSLRGLTAVVRKIWFSPSSERVAALSDQWMLAVWDVPTRRLLYQFEAPTGTLADGAGAAFDASGRWLAFATGTAVHLYDLESGRVTERWNLNDGLSDELQFDDRGRLLLLRRESWDGVRPRQAWRLYELKRGAAPALLHAQSDPDWRAYNVALPFGAKKFLVWNGGRRPGPRTIQVRDVVTGQLLVEVDARMTDNAPSVFVDAKGQWFGYKPGDKNRTHLVALDDFRELPMSDVPFESISPSAEETAGSGWIIRPLDSGKAGIRMADEWLQSLPPRFSPNGRYLALGSLKGVVYVADLPEVRRRIKTLVR